MGGDNIKSPEEIMLNQKNSQKLVDIKSSHPSKWIAIENYCIKNIMMNDAVDFDEAKYPDGYLTKYDFNIGLLEKVDEILGQCDVSEDVLGTYSMKTYKALIQLVALHSDKLRYILG